MREKIERSGLTPLFISKKIGIGEQILEKMLLGEKTMSPDVKDHINKVLDEVNNLSIDTNISDPVPLHERVKKCGLASKFIADLLQIDPPSFSQMLSGKRKFPKGVREKIESIIEQANDISV